MAYQLVSAILMGDEIDRLLFSFDKMKSYSSKMISDIDRQSNTWNRHRTNMQNECAVVPDFLLKKIQRVIDLSVEAVEALCRTELLMEQISRTDFSTFGLHQQSDMNMEPPRTVPSTHSPNESKLRPFGSFNGKPVNQQFAPNCTIPRLQSRTLSSGQSTETPAQRNGFRPVVRPQATEPSAFDPVNNRNFAPATQYVKVNYSTVPGSTGSSSTFNNHFDRLSSSDKTPPVPIPQPGKKEEIELQRIRPGTIWKTAKIEFVVSPSGFYVQNLDPHVRDAVDRMFENLQTTYNSLEKSSRLQPLRNIAIGDFGVVKCPTDKRWHRARVITCEENDQVSIVFVDCGNTAMISIDGFFPVTSPFINIPAQAIACTLSEAFPRDVCDDENTWSNEVTQMFNEEVANKVVEVHFPEQQQETKSWPLPFVRVIVNNQSLKNILNSRNQIHTYTNQQIAEHLSMTVSGHTYMIYNIPINQDEFDS